MKKKVLAAMLVAAMTATMFAGCGSKDNGASNDGTQAANSGSTSESAEPVDVKLTVMGPSEDQDDAQGAWLKTECEAFNEEHPEWNIKYEYVTCSESDAKDTVLQDPASAADVYMFANDQIADLVDAGALTKLGGDVAEYVKSSNPEAMAATVTYNGDIYGVPYTPNTWFMYYDKRVFSEDDVETALIQCLRKEKFLSHLTMAGILLPSMQQTDVQSSEMVQMHLRDMTSAETTL